MQRAPPDAKAANGLTEANVTPQMKVPHGHWAHLTMEGLKPAHVFCSNTEWFFIPIRVQYGAEEKGKARTSRNPGVEASLYHIPVLSLSFLIYKMGIVIL